MTFLSKYYKILEQEDTGIDFEVIRQTLKDSIYVDEGDMIVWMKPEIGSFAYLDKSDNEFTFSGNGKTWQIDFSKPVQHKGAWGLGPKDLMSISKQGTSQNVAEIYLGIIKKKIESM